MNVNSSAETKPKIGAGHMEAMGRLGIQELRNAVSLSATNVEAPTEPGLVGTATPSEVVEQRNNDLQSPSEDRDSIFEGRIKSEPDRQPASRDDRGRDRPSMEKE